MSAGKTPPVHAATALAAPIGAIFKQPDLAKTLEEYFTGDPWKLDEFYRGGMAGEIVAAAKGGLNTVTGAAKRPGDFTGNPSG